MHCMYSYEIIVTETMIEDKRLDKWKSESAFRFHSKIPSENILQYLSSCSESSTDVTIYCSDGTVAAHKLVLASLSKMLFKVFKCQDHEEDTSVILPDFTVAQISSYFKEIFLGADVLQDPQYLSINTALALASTPDVKQPQNEILVKNEVNDSCDNEEMFSSDTTIIFKKEDSDHENSEALVKLKENECFESYDDNEEMFSSVTTIKFIKEDSDHENPVESAVKQKEKTKSNVDNAKNKKKNEKKNVRGMYSCDQCDFEAKWLTPLKMHKARTEGHREYGTKISKLDSKIWPHFSLDPSDVKRAICKYCKASLRSKSTDGLANHLNSKHGILVKLDGKDGIKGKKPSKIKPQWEFLEDIQSDPFKVLCKICGITLTKSNGVRHVLNNHKIGQPNQKYQCSFCGKAHRDDNQRKVHEILEHTQNYPLYCDECGKGFVFASTLEKHRKFIHSPEDNENVCPHCGTKFSTKASLENHIKIVHDGFKLQCPHCDYTNGKKANLDMHIKIKHEGLTFPCPHCNYKATRKHNLEVHIKTTHEGLRFNCPHCDFQVTRKDYLEKHINTTHLNLIS